MLWLRLCAMLAALMSAAPASLAGEQALLVFAPASLRDAMEEALDAWHGSGGAPAKAAYASSSTLARQIELGAHADVYISASVAWMDYLRERGLLRASTRRDLVGNELVLVAPRSSALSARISRQLDLAHLVGDGRLAMGDPDHVPAGMYARQALQRLGLWDSVAARVARADNVRAALALVARGEAVLGIVYASDALAEPDVRVLDTFAPDTHAAIVYPVAVLSDSRHPQAARLLAFLVSAPALARFERHGFRRLVD